ncbi:MAG: GNAT family N-acetyltransferase [Bacillota bacterium]|nr:GNAT family N-acetyltransferase [Bacillota bacterium]
MYENFVRIEKKHYDAAAALLAEAFMDNPLFCYLFPDEKTREKVLPLIFRSTVEVFSTAGDAYATSESMEGIFFARRTGEKGPGIFTFLRIAVKSLKLIGRVPLIKTIRRGKRIARSTSEMYRYISSFKDYLWLDMIAVGKKYRGQKFMSRMMRQILAGADNNHIPCVLETESPVNVEIYRHFGFKLGKEIAAVDGGLTYYVMVYETK